MADSKISALAAATSLVATDQFAIATGGVNKSVLFSLLAARTRTPRATNTILGANDVGKFFDATAAFTQTLTAAATLGAGWWCIVRNATTDGTSLVVIDPNLAETIDGLATATMYSGESRLIFCDGSNFTSILLSGGFAKFIATGSFIMPAGCSVVYYDLIGKGGNGGAGAGGAAATARPGGSGGGGGGRTQGHIPAALMTPGSTFSVTLSASTTTFQNAQAYAGGAGVDGNSAGVGVSQSGGSGGGAGEFGLPGDITPQAGGGHRDPNTAPNFSMPGQGQCGADSQMNGIGLGADWGGGSGGSPKGDGTSAAGLHHGGTSNRGGGGGGGGGGISTANTAQAGGNGGNSGFYTDTGGNGGGAGGAATGVAGGVGADGLTANVGKGGGGGGSNAAGTGGAGGNGGLPGGAGGGGGGGTTVGGVGGTGGRGEARIYYA